MKLNLVKIFICFCCCGLVGCDPYYNVDFEIKNYSEKSISIYVQHPWIDQDTNIISGNTKLIFFNASGIGSTTHQYLNNLDTIAFEIFITNSNGIHFKKNTSSISNWDITYPSKSDGIGKVQLTVRDEDFE